MAENIRENPKSAGEVPGTRWYGVYPALVRDLNDPENMGRIKILMTWAVDAGGMTGIEKGQQYETWARVATMAAGNDRGSWFMPELNDEVLVAFQGGDPAYPYVMGMLWNGNDAPPETMDPSNENNVKVLKTRSGAQIRIDDKQGNEQIELRIPGGQAVRLNGAGNGKVDLEDASGNHVSIESGEINIHHGSKIRLSGGGIIEIEGLAVNISSGMTTVSGTLRCDTLITKSVVAQTYTPGAGNVW